MKIGKWCAVVAVVFALGLMVGPAFAATEKVYDDNGNLVVTITYDSEHEILDYVAGASIHLDVVITYAWQANYSDDGTSLDESIERKKPYTPKGVTGFLTNEGGDKDKADIDFRFMCENLHVTDGDGMGNAHFHVLLDVAWVYTGTDTGVDGGTTVKLGVNCHAEDPDYVADNPCG